ncbi:hypothetical protein [Ruania alba]|uniref:Uncharacterized protein n=1 Tax=Ruania alba TaxID=648782 RepID=A0A1H5N5I5_9MICO|nr:hypothetical protein [Ruania alba]SEE96862.1 hypothetical protein SAMN04488554_3967 [Ruania alba]
MVSESRVPESPRLRVTLHTTETSAAVLSAARSLGGAGLMTLRQRVISSAPILEEEMFTNAWYDGLADQLLQQLTAWHDQGVRFELSEMPPGDHPEATVKISLKHLQNIIEAGRVESHCGTGADARRLPLSRG